MFLKIYFFLKYFSLIGSLILLVILIYYFRKLKIFQEWRDSFKEKIGIGPIPKAKNKQWLKVEKLLSEEFSSSLKLAVLEARKIVYEALKNLGYKGENFKEIINQLEDQGFQNLDIFEEAVNFTDKLIENPKIEVTQIEAKRIVLIFKKFYQDLFSLII
ncbi:MAG TPA: hypothetical protein PK119_01265 [Candidatus Paceibacterota bacterium]|nr:hypothetical protein [Candidatus Paceibacterota bacterium]